MRRTIILSVFTMLIFISCQRNSTIELRLNHAEKLMSEHPDSAWHILESIDRKALDSRRIRARHALLSSQALDKNYIDVDNDSLIKITYDYYGSRNSSDSLKFLSEYYYGRICQNAGDFRQAILRYLVAEQYCYPRQKYFGGDELHFWKSESVSMPDRSRAYPIIKIVGRWIIIE